MLQPLYFFQSSRRASGMRSGFCLFVHAHLYIFINI